MQATAIWWGSKSSDPFLLVAYARDSEKKIVGNFGRPKGVLSLASYIVPV